MGSEFSNANMTAPGLEDFTYQLLGEEICSGKSCIKIAAIPVSADLGDEYGYARSVFWVDKNSYLVYQTTYFNFDSELFKTITNKEFKKLNELDGKYMVTEMLAVNHLNSRVSKLVMEQVAVTPAKQSYFTVAYLEKE